jgi:hemerythrin-like domain-containing protein
MNATETLKHEHEIILLVLQAAEREAQSIGQTGRVGISEVRKMLDFFTHFLDHCHHRKEEEHLFLKLQECGLPRESGPLAVMLHEHEEGKRLLVAIQQALPGAEAGDPDSTKVIKANLMVYAALLRGHIQKENNVLYPMADSMLSGEDQKALTEAFAKMEAEEIGEGVHERYHQLAHALAEGYAEVGRQEV